MEPQDFALTPTIGLVGGLTIQFAEGRWREEIGEGVALSEDGFDLVEPLLKVACPEWTDGHRYGVFELSVQTQAALVKLLRSEAERLRHVSDGWERRADLLGNLADWLEARCDQRTISILGI